MPAAMSPPHHQGGSEMHTPVYRHQDYRSFLAAEFDRRQARNPAYSLRAFARDLKIAPSTLSEIFNRQHGLSPVRAARVAAEMGMSKDERVYFCRLVEAENATTERRKRKAREEIAAMNASVSASVLRVSLQFEVEREKHEMLAARINAFTRELEARAVQVSRQPAVEL